MIALKNITKIYKNEHVETRALDGVSFNIKKGDFVAIMGPSGSGKSTLMHIVGALDTPTSGEYILDDQKVGQLGDDALAEIRNKKIGFIFQSFNLLRGTPASKNVMLPMVYAGISLEKRMDLAKKLLSDVDLADKEDSLPGQLSGGQQQRVAIARALAMKPSIILADEPTGNLDTSSGEEIMDIFQKLNREGNTIIMITHERYIAEHAKRIILLRDGKVVEDDGNNRQRRKLT
ncbi:MAG: ABC transporter ATP-binding protein [Thermodesulfovibrionia bacterium]|nr:MAG: ABC transporter ATP-binding protein [Thermodesulfovibrionia bacterium]